MTIKKLLISNRGEIASRIIKSAHDMGITCVAIYTEADKNTPYVREADQSFKLSDSYLNAKEILEIAKKNNVDEDNRVNWPDYQWRIWKNLPEIKWKNKVHEVLEGYSTYAALPAAPKFTLIHPKTISRQEKQNAYYDAL